MTDTLLPCSVCGAPCRVEAFGGGIYCTPWTGYLCSRNKLFGGKCPDENVYLTAEFWNTRPEQQNTDINADWLIAQLEAWPKRVDPEKTTNIEFLMKSAAGALKATNHPTAQATDAMIADAAKAYAEAIQFGHLGFAMKAALEAALLTTSPRQTEGLVERDALAEALAETHNERAGLVEAIKSALAHRYGDWCPILEAALLNLERPKK